MRFLLMCLLILCFSLVHTDGAVAADPFVRVSGKKFTLDGATYQFTGVNAFNLATYPGANAGCGSYVADLDGFFSKLRPNAMVRLWAFQGTAATNVSTKKLDWTGLDRVVNAAQKNGKKLIFVLGDQSGHCDDGHWKDKAWYQGGYKSAYNDLGNGLTPLAYFEYVKQVVSRYKDSPAVAMWEPMNEPNAANCLNGKKGYECYGNQSCPDEAAAATALRTFFDSVGGTIKSIDTRHLVSSGTIGDGQCGTIFEDYKYVHASSGIDVGSYHDYQRNDQPMPGDQWNGLKKRLDQMALLNKPLIIGEAGMLANSTGVGCLSYTSRKDKMKAKMDAQFPAGVAGFMPWSLTLAPSSTGCNYDLVAGDPLVTLLRDYPVSMSSVVPPANITPFPSPTPVPADTQPPSAPSGLVATGKTSSSISLTWNPSTDNVGVVRYEIYRDYYYVTATTDTTYTNTGLTAAKNYMYFIKARDAAGNTSAGSNMLTVMTNYIGASPTPTRTPTKTPTPAPDTQPPTAPTNLRATNVTSTSVTLTWTPGTDNVGVDRYEVYKDYWYVTAVWGTSYTNTGLTPGKTYLYYLKSRDKAGNSSGESMKISVTTLP